MNSRRQIMNRLLDHLASLLEIPKSHYERAADRYRSLSDWLCRDNSSVRQFDPELYPQGSFRYGTVIRPLTRNEEYDLDVVAELILLSKAAITQRDVKALVGAEIVAYADAHSFKEPAEEKKRCWRLNYADEVSFHMDILPAVPDDDQTKAWLIANGVSREFAELAVAITDKQHPEFDQLCTTWPRSNPKGFGGWFEEQMREVGRARAADLVLNREYASIDDVPPYEWRTPLQRAIQILKRHRDVMFQRAPSKKPISMIITTLSAQAYNGETDLAAALGNIVNRMTELVRPSVPRVPNPVNPPEDFADKWVSDPSLEANFWSWHTQVCADLARLESELSRAAIVDLIENRFAETLGTRYADSILGLSAVAASPPTATPRVVTVGSSAPKPWREND